MKAYVTTTGVVFGLLALVHVWRVVEEGGHLLRDPFFVLLTLTAAALAFWAWRLVRLSTRS